MAKRFWHSNKEYCQLIYEHTGLWADKASYTDDNTEYYLYYYGEKGKQLKKMLKKVTGKLTYVEGANVKWSAKEGCLTLYFDE